MSALENRQSNAQLRRLQILLLLLIVWDLVALLAETTFGSFLMKIEGDKVGGILAARTSFSAAAAVPIGVYVYGLVRSPLRHRGVMWVAIVEQTTAALAAVYHIAGDDIEVEGAVLPLAVALVLLFLLVINLPRGDAHS